MSDEDDSEDERTAMTARNGLALREKSERRSKTPKTYRETGEDADDEAKYSKEVNEDMDISGNAFAGGHGEDFADAMSDVSAFDPGAEFN